MDHAPCNETQKPKGPRAVAARGPFALASPCAGPHPVTGNPKAKGPRAAAARGPFASFANFPNHGISCDTGRLRSLLKSKFNSIWANNMLRQMLRKKPFFARLHQASHSISETGYHTYKLRSDFAHIYSLTPIS